MAGVSLSCLRWFLVPSFCMSEISNAILGAKHGLQAAWACVLGDITQASGMYHRENDITDAPVCHTLWLFKGCNRIPKQDFGMHWQNTSNLGWTLKLPVCWGWRNSPKDCPPCLRNPWGFSWSSKSPHPSKSGHPSRWKRGLSPLSIVLSLPLTLSLVLSLSRTRTSLLQISLFKDLSFYIGSLERFQGSWDCSMPTEMCFGYPNDGWARLASTSIHFQHAGSDMLNVPRHGAVCTNINCLSQKLIVSMREHHPRVSLPSFLSTSFSMLLPQPPPNGSFQQVPYGRRWEMGEYVPLKI